MCHKIDCLKLKKKTRKQMFKEGFSCPLKKFYQSRQPRACCHLIDHLNSDPY